MKYIFLIPLLFYISSCSHIYFGNPLIKNKELREKDYQEYLDRKDREKRNAKEYQLQQKIETDREFFIQNCNTIDSVEAREECLRNIPN